MVNLFSHGDRGFRRRSRPEARLVAELAEVAVRVGETGHRAPDVRRAPDLDALGLELLRRSLDVGDVEAQLGGVLRQRLLGGGRRPVDLDHQIGAAEVAAGEMRARLVGDEQDGQPDRLGIERNAGFVLLGEQTVSGSNPAA